jgi:hypothetical protein
LGNDVHSCSAPWLHPPEPSPAGLSDEFGCAPECCGLYGPKLAIPSWEEASEVFREWIALDRIEKSVERKRSPFGESDHTKFVTIPGAGSLENGDSQQDNWQEK